MSTSDLFVPVSQLLVNFRRQNNQIKNTSDWEQYLCIDTHTYTLMNKRDRITTIKLDSEYNKLCSILKKKNKDINLNITSMGQFLYYL